MPAKFNEKIPYYEIWMRGEFDPEFSKLRPRRNVPGYYTAINAIRVAQTHVRTPHLGNFMPLRATRVYLVEDNKRTLIASFNEEIFDTIAVSMVTEKYIR
jgi:hypothetical protein